MLSLCTKPQTKRLASVASAHGFAASVAEVIQSTSPVNVLRRLASYNDRMSVTQHHGLWTIRWRPEMKSIVGFAAALAAIALSLGTSYASDWVAAYALVDKVV